MTYCISPLEPRAPHGLSAVGTKDPVSHPPTPHPLGGHGVHILKNQLNEHFTSVTCVWIHWKNSFFSLAIVTFRNRYHRLVYIFFRVGFFYLSLLKRPQLRQSFVRAFVNKRFIRCLNIFSDIWIEYILITDKIYVDSSGIFGYLIFILSEAVKHAVPDGGTRDTETLQAWEGCMHWLGVARSLYPSLSNAYISSPFRTANQSLLQRILASQKLPWFSNIEGNLINII